MKHEGLPTKATISFQESARIALADTQLRRNMGKATQTIRAKRAEVVDELPDWQALREAGRAIKARTLRHLDTYLLELEAAVQRAGGQVHWARDAHEANQIVTQLVAGHGAREVVKVKSLTTDEIGLNAALAAAGITAIETDLAELIIQLAGESSSHILVPAIHKNRAEIRELFRRKLGVDQLSDEPSALAAAARDHLRRKFLTTSVAISGANFAVAETGTVCVVESEGNGRMCLTLPRLLISIMGIEKVIPTWQDFEVFLQLLPRSSTGERMNPYTSFWTGVTPGDGPQEFHLVLLDNGRTKVLADQIGRQALNCIRCSACLNICPVYERTGGHAYHSVYPGPIGAILTPQLVGVAKAGSLPYASSLCGACYEVCPVKINIPEVLIYLRGRVVRSKQDHTLRERLDPENLAMKLLARVFMSRARYERAQQLARIGQWPLVHRGFIEYLPGPLSGWTAMRDLHAVPRQTFREWWRERTKNREPRTES
jgi:L-lactate dehydrogenase complex protein LldF